MTTPQKRRRSVDRMANQAVGYLRVSTDKQVESGAGLAGQRAAIEAYAAARGLEITAWFAEDEGVSGSVEPMSRPAMSAALDALRAGPAAVFLFGKVDRVSRTALDLLKLADTAKAQGWTLAAADGTVDLSTPQGVAMFTVQGAFAQLERAMISSRTREGLAAKRAQGVRLGRPSVLPADVVKRIVEAHDAGQGWSAIARALMEDGIPTARNGTVWHPSAVQKVYQGQDAAALAG